MAVCFEQQGDYAAYILCWNEPALMGIAHSRDAAAHYAPYVPLMSNGLVKDPNTLAPIDLGPKD